MRYFLIALFVLIIGYSIGLFFNNSETHVISLIFMYPRSMHLGLVLGVGFVFSFSFGLMIGGSAWMSLNTKHESLKKANDGLKGKLKKTNEDLEYQTKKMSIFEDTIKVEANKKPPPKKKEKPKKTFLGIPIK